MIDSSTCPFTNCESLADRVYLKAKPLTLQLTDTELLAVDSDDGGGLRFRAGGGSRFWPPGDSLIEYRRPGVTATLAASARDSNGAGNGD